MVYVSINIPYITFRLGATISMNNDQACDMRVFSSSAGGLRNQAPIRGGNSDWTSLGLWYHGVGGSGFPGQRLAVAAALRYLTLRPLYSLAIVSGVRLWNNRYFHLYHFWFVLQCKDTLISAVSVCV